MPKFILHPGHRIKTLLGYITALGLVIGFTASFTSHALAQTMMGDFTGTVTDPSHASIPKATITFINETTRATRTASTDSSGTYRVSGLLPGTYTIQVEAAGFKKFEQSGITMSPAVVKPVNVSLEVGAITETVEVRGGVPTIETESATVSYSIPRIVAEKPTVLDARQNGFAEEALAWAPGSSAGQSVYQYAGTRPGFQQANIEGVQRSFTSIHVNVDAVSEVHVVSMTPAEYARPATVDVTFKGGSNRLTGTILVNYFNVNCLNALSSPFSNPTPGPCTSIWRPFYSVSGPVYIPNVYDGRNKTFFYFGYHKNPTQTLTGPAANYSLPTLAMQAGDFSNYPKTIIDPTTGQRFLGNIIPPNRISPVAKTITNQLIGNNYTYVGGPNNFQANGAQTGVVQFLQRYWIVRVDQNAGRNDVFAFTLHHGVEGTNDVTAFNGGINLGGPVVGLLLPTIANTGALSETHTFSPRVVNQARIGFSRAINQATWSKRDLATPVYGEQVLKDWGIQGITAPHLTGYPGIAINGWATLSANESGDFDTRYIAYDNLTFNKGQHTFKTGFSLTKLLDDGPAVGPYFGNFEFTGQFTSEPFADFLLGLPGTFQRYIPRPTVARRRYEVGAFIQDDFRVTPKLTLLYGLRWNKFTVPYDKNGLYYNFDPGTLSIVVPDQRALQNVSPAWPVNTFPVRLADQAGYSSKLIDGSSSWQPRLGFAYRFADRMVFRGGYGIYDGALRFNSLQTQGPFTVTETFINSVNPASPTGATYAWPNPYPSTSAVAEVLSATGVSKHYRNPYSQNWQLSLERELAPNWGLRATYLGVAGARLIWNQNLNEVVASTQPFSQSRRPNPGLQTIGYVQNGGNSFYESLQVLVTHSWANGFYTTAAYTRAWNRTDSYGGLLAYDQNAYSPEYSYNLRRDWGHDSIDVAHDIVLNWVGELPFGRGKRFGSNANRLLNWMVSNWTISGIFSRRSGIWFTPTETGTDLGNIGKFGGRRVSQVPGCDPYSGAGDVHRLWFNPACFTLPASGQLGDVSPGSLHGPSGTVFMIDPYKEFPLKFRENAKLRIGAQIFNLFNHPAYGVPNANISSPSAGKIFSTANVRGFALDEAGQRSVFFSAKLTF